MKTLLITTVILGNMILSSAQEFNSLSNNKQTWVHTGIYTGVWIATDQLRNVGNHPFTGLQLNVEHNKMNYQLFFDFRFLKSKLPYDFYYNYLDTMVTTSSFFSGEYGFSLSRQILSSEKNILLLRCGIAADFIKAINTRDKNKTYYYKAPVNMKDKKDLDKYLNTYNVSIGLSDRIHLKNKNYLEFDASYHFVDYTLKNKSGLKGDVISTSVSYNFLLK